MKYYRREGRRFVQTDVPQPVNNAGKYYQKDGSFSNECTSDSIGLCIVSYATHHVVMYLHEIAGTYTHDEAVEEAKKFFSGKGEVPQLNDLLTAFIYYKKQLNISTLKDYRAIGPISASYAAFANHAGTAGYDPAWNTRFVAALRPVVNIKQL